MKIRILIVEDEPLVAATLKRILDKLDYEVVAMSMTYELAIYDIEQYKPDIVLLDIRLGSEKDGIDVARLLKEKYHIPFVFLTALADRHTLDRAKKTEPSGYILKPFDENDIHVNLEIAIYNHAQREKLQFPLPDWDKISGLLEFPLTNREMDVLMQLFEGKSNAKIAADLFLSVNTVKSHLIRLYQKLDVTTRTEALAYIRKLSRGVPF